jgi:NADH-quinone oxidoreductase subunit I/NAD(P)H-quinone oxidoreductase subunit I
MYCGFCVEACPVVAQAPGDQEKTSAIRFTREFEGTTENYAGMIYRFIRPGDRVIVAKNKKGQIHPTPARGERLREARQLAERTNPKIVERVALASDLEPEEEE